METKKCSYCQKHKSLEWFSKSSRACIPCQKEYDRKHYQKNKERKKRYRKEYVKNNRDKINKAERKKKENNINFKLGQNLRSRLRRAISRNQKAGSTVRDLGCSIEELRTHLENQFYPNSKTGEG